MSRSHIPYFSLYPADFMNGVRGMSAQEVGVYMMLLCRIYEENGPVEGNILRLSTYCGMRQSTFEKTLEKLVALGKLTLIDGMLSNDRAEIEISKRANDLKNSSKAGKASAEKRQQKQQSSPTTVEVPFNHTDTDTDTDTIGGGGGSAGAREPGLPDDQPTFRERVLEAMGVPDGIVGASKFVGGQGDVAEAMRWLELPGITEDVAVQQVAETTRAKADGPAHSFRYFTPAMQRLSAQISMPPLAVGPSQPPRASPHVQPDVAAIFAKLEAEGRI